MLDAKLGRQIICYRQIGSYLVSAAQVRAVIRKFFEIDDVGKLYDGCNEAIAWKSIRRSTVEDRLIWPQKI